MKTTLPFSLYQILLCITLLPTNKISCFPTNHPTFITKSCQTTLYPHLCNQILAKYATTVKKSPKRLAITALVVAFKTTRSTAKFVQNMSRNGALRRGEKAAIIECVEEVGDAVFELRKSLKELNHSRKGRPKFDLQMNDVQTWVSAALTDEDTCMDDFTTQGKAKALVRRIVLTVAHMSSIALSFINSYAGVA